MIAGLIHFIWKVIWNTTAILVCAGLVFIGFKANQPMTVTGAPEGLTYVEFMHSGQVRHCKKLLNFRDVVGE